MSSEYQDYPQHVLVETPTGVVELSITDNNHIYINGSGQCRECSQVLTQKVRGREVNASLHMNDYGSDFEPTRDQGNPQSSYHAFYSSKATDAQRKALIASWVPAINEFMKNHSDLRTKGKDAHANNRIMKIEEEIKELQENISAKQAEIAALIEGQDPAQRVVQFKCCGAYGNPNPNHKCEARRDWDNS